MIYDVTIDTEKELSHWETQASTRKQLEALGITKLKWITGSNGPSGNSQTWRVVVDESMGTLLALKFASVSTKQYDIVANNLRQLEEEYAASKARLLALLAGEHIF